jgi:hypothetical protein
MFSIASSFDTFGIIFFNIPEDVNYQTIQQAGEADGSFNSLGFRKAWQTNLTRHLMSIPNLLPSDSLLATSTKL